MSRELTQKVPQGRPVRQRMTRRNRLEVKDRDPNYHYRIVNDVDDRIEAAKLAGYEVVERPGKVSDTRVDVPSGIGSSMISVGGGQKAVVMRIRKDWYKEDQQAKQAEITSLENSMKESAKSYIRGDMEIDSKTGTDSLKV